MARCCSPTTTWGPSTGRRPDSARPHTPTRRAPRRPGPRDPDKTAAGRGAAERYHCGSCHTPTFAGQQYVPRLAGLSYDYVLRQLRAFKAQQRAELDGTMTASVQPLTEQDIENLAQYIATVLRKD